MCTHKEKDTISDVRQHGGYRIPEINDGPMSLRDRIYVVWYPTDDEVVSIIIIIIIVSTTQFYNR